MPESLNQERNAEEKLCQITLHQALVNLQLHLIQIQCGVQGLAILYIRPRTSPRSQRPHHSSVNHSFLVKMVSFTTTAFTVLAAFAACTAASPVAVAAPAMTPAPDMKLAKRASCTFTGSAGAASASKSQASCATIVLSGITVPSGTTLDLSDLADDTTVSHFRQQHSKTSSTDICYTGHLRGQDNLGVRRMVWTSSPDRGYRY